MRKLFLKPNTNGLIPTGGYTGNFNYSNKAMIWLIYREQTDGCTILFAHNGREYRPPEIPQMIMEFFLRRNGNSVRVLCSFYHSYTCLPFGNVTSLRGKTLAERYERAMARLLQITSVGYGVEVEWECV